MSNPVRTIDAVGLKAALHDGGEIALLEENIEDAMRAYLSWAIALADQMATEEHQRFRIIAC